MIITFQNEKTQILTTFLWLRQVCSMERHNTLSKMKCNLMYHVPVTTEGSHTDIMKCQGKKNFSDSFYFAAVLET